LKKIDLWGNENLGKVCPKLLKEAICHCEDVDVASTDLSLKQVKALLSFIPSKNILKGINLSSNNLGKVSPAMLTKAVFHLKNVCLGNTRLTTKQINALFSFMPTQNVLKKLNLEDESSLYIRHYLRGPS